MTTELATRDDMMPALSMEAAVQRYNAVLDFTKTIMKPGKDYGAIPGTDKPTLLKPGAEKLCSFFGLGVDYVELEKMCDWQTGFFFFTYKAVLSRHGETVATGIGSCNSKEKKYRWRNADLKCPKCGQETILKSKNDPGYFCWKKRGGCGLSFADNDPMIVSQPRGKVENTETFDLVNTIQKMAQKRALIAATLIAANASEFYTQDLEDLDTINTDQTEDPKPSAKTNEKTEAKAEKPKVTPERAGELIALCKLKSVPEDKVTEWLNKAHADSFDDMKAETVEYIFKIVAALPTPAPSGQLTGSESRYLKFYDQATEAAQETGLTESELQAALKKAAKNLKLKSPEDMSDGMQKQTLEAIREGRGFYTPANPKEVTA